MERYGYLMMPLLTNVPEPKNKEWTLTTCQGCGEKCWDRPVPNHFAFQGKLCTKCVLKQAEKGVKNV